MAMWPPCGSKQSVLQQRNNKLILEQPDRHHMHTQDGAIGVSRPQCVSTFSIGLFLLQRRTSKVET